MGSFHSVWCRVCWEKKIAKKVHADKAHFSTWKMAVNVIGVQLTNHVFVKLGQTVISVGLLGIQG